MSLLPNRVVGARSAAGVAAAVLVATAAAATAQVAPGLDGVSSEGVRVNLTGRYATVVLNRPLPRRAKLEVECGREGKAGKSVAEGVKRGRRLRTVRVRLRWEHVRPEWCRWSQHGRRRFGAAQLEGAPPAPAHLRRGQGVREGGSLEDNLETDGAIFRQRENVVTVELRRPFRTSRLGGLACGTGGKAIGYRTFAAPAGERFLTADLEADVTRADWCLLEEHGGTDVAGADMP